VKNAIINAIRRLLGIDKELAALRLDVQRLEATKANHRKGKKK
jgi:hypothetical protein